ncbi:MAG TPA: HD domain-containing phosphohydrolase [Acetobacteraceae bacterium]|nr:HD domain-containing phosphohydrolase [Acetobacteraceae bacterium]
MMDHDTPPDLAIAPDQSARPCQAAPRIAPTDANALAAAFELSSSGLLILDVDNAVIAANTRFARMWGLTDAAIVAGVYGLPEALIARVADPAGFAARLRRLDCHPEEAMHDETMLADGSIFSWHTGPIPGADGTPQSRAWFFRDVTQQRVAEARLREEEEKFRSVVEQDIAGVCIIGDDSCIAYANAAYARLFGYTPAQLAGMPLLDIVPPEERETVTAALAAQFAGERRVVRIVSSVSAKDGHAVDIMVQASGAAYRGRPASVAVVIDISELQQAKRALELADIIVAQSPVVLFRLAPDGEFPTTYVSRNVARFGYDATPDDAGGFRLPQHIHPADKLRIAAGLRSLAGGVTGVLSDDCRLLGRDGQVCWVHAQIAALRDAKGNVTALQGTLIDIAERKHAERSLERLNRALRTLSSGNEVVVRAKSEHQLLDEMCRVLVEVGEYRRCWIGFAGAAEQSPIRVMSACGCAPSAAAAVETDAPVNALRSMSPVVAVACDAGETWAALPFALGPAARGVMALCSSAAHAFDADALKLLSELANDLAYGVLSLRAHAARDSSEQRLRDSMRATVQALASTLELRDPYTAGHQRRVAALAAAIARSLGIAEDEIHGIELAAMVHDVGKVQVPGEILTKPGKLTSLEYQLVQVHAQAGHDILKGIDFPWPVAQMVGQHHERLDGSGYPNHLSGDAILMGSRIIAVADVVETMMNHRPYRAALGRDAAMAEIASGRNHLFDAEVVDACLRLFREDAFCFA